MTQSIPFSLPEPARFELGSLPLRPYVNVYRFGAGGPLVIYLGGSVTPTVYEARRRSPPTPIAAAFERARRALGETSVDLAVSPCPLHDGGDPEGWVTELLDALGAQLGAPSALGCVGYSAGAALALRLALLEPRSVASVFGASGITGLLDEVRELADERARKGDRLALGWWMNAEDPLAMASEWVRRFPSIDVTMSTRPGRHPFADYEANGSVEDAFRFVLARVRER